MPSPLGTVVIENELECVSGGSSAPASVSANSSAALGSNGTLGSNTTGTCLYVTLMDNYGDGWLDTTKFYYWVQIREDDSNVVSMSLDCGCVQMSGCIRPSELNIDQQYHMTLVASDAEGNVHVPEYAWEMHWTVQVVEGDVWKEKYYGGYNTSMVFHYSRSSGTYALSWWQNLWRYPVEGDEALSSAGCGVNHSFAEYTRDVVQVTAACRRRSWACPLRMTCWRTK
jgi:hypothetical protein